MPATPETPTPEPPPSLLDKLAVAIPVAMTALATIFAGLSSGELQKAMFWRTAAGQDQARATNQWTFAGLKRNRALITEATAAPLALAAGFKTADFGRDWTGVQKQAAEWLSGGGPPDVRLPKVEDKKILDLLAAIKARKPEVEIATQAAAVKHAEINAAIDAAADLIARTDKEWEAVLDAAKDLIGTRPGPERVAASFALEQRRYRAESRLEMGLGFLYDARVHVVTAVSDQHRRRSQNFFYAMLAGQIAAVVSTLALSRKTSLTLWLLAGCLGRARWGTAGSCV